MQVCVRSAPTQKAVSCVAVYLVMIAKVAIFFAQVLGQLIAEYSLAFQQVHTLFYFHILVVLDIDECKANISKANVSSCGNFSICNNAEGNFTCDCVDGYEQLDSLNCGGNY